MKSTPVPFLKQVAQVYVKNENAKDLADYCFVFPNRRSSSFFTRKFLREVITEQGNQHVVVFPQALTISDFISSLSTNKLASRIELQFLLYKVYLTIAGEKPMEFDKFIFFGDIILNDFNDADQYLADATALFKNVSEEKEIRTDYLTDEQKQVLETFFPNLHFEKNDNEDEKAFWEHLANGERKDNFKSIWGLLAELYVRFNDALNEVGIAYAGKMSREVAGMLENISAENFSFKRVIFVGFNAITTAEMKIFSALKKKGIADFYWDDYSPVISEKECRGGMFVNNLKRLFSSRYELESFADIKHKPNINIISVPSNNGQARHIPSVLSKLIESNALEIGDNAVNTAIVLPDESMFLPVVSSIPESFGKLNVTMGFPMRNTDVANVLSTIVRLLIRAKAVKESNETKWEYFHEDVKSLLSIPLITKICPNEISKVLSDIIKTHTFFVSNEDLSDGLPKLKDFFSLYIKQTTDAATIVNYLNGIINVLGNSTLSDVEMQVVDQMREAINTISSAMAKYDIHQMYIETFLRMVEKIINTETLDFCGEPIHGLQLMGVLETRCLDFENLIIPSMNERIFPRKHFSKTFIPNHIRRYFGLSTMAYQEAISAYTFYRLISRANNVTLLYDARTKGTSSGEFSRYISQLIYLHKDYFTLSQSVVKYTPNVTEVSPISIEKKPEELEPYLTPNSGKHLSASALKDYISCPLMFYLKDVKGYYEENNVSDWIDGASFGTIFHDSMMEIYNLLSNDSKQIIYQASLFNVIEELRKREGSTFSQIENIIIKTINKVYHGKVNDTLLATDKILFDLFLHYIIFTLQYDAKNGNMKFISAEKDMRPTWTFTDKDGKERTLNFRMFIDRIDEVGGVRRIVDYKTGSDSLACNEIGELFTFNKDKHYGGFFQVLLYCALYKHNNNFTNQLKPIIYGIRQIANATDMSFTINKVKIDDFSGDIENEFIAHFNALLCSIFDYSQPFEQSKDPDSCEYCSFKELCRKQ